MEAGQPTAWPIAWRRKKVFYVETARARLRSPIIDANGPTVTVWRCLLIGEDRRVKMTRMTQTGSRADMKKVL